MLPRRLGMCGGTPQHDRVVGLSGREHDVFAEIGMQLAEDLLPVDLCARRHIWGAHTSPVILLRADLTVQRACFSLSPTDTAVEISSCSISSRIPFSAALQAAQKRASLTPSVTNLATKST